MSLSARVFSLLEGVGIAFDSIRANKVRAALTILGVAIGVFVVVAISAAIHGINRSVAKRLRGGRADLVLHLQIPDRVQRLRRERRDLPLDPHPSAHHRRGGRRSRAYPPFAA